LQFAAFVYGQEKAGKPLTLEELLILNHLYFNRRIDSPAAGGLIQKGSAAALGILEKLVEKGFVEAKGERKGRIYVLSASMYKKLGNPSGFIRVMGYDRIDQEQMVMRFIDAYGRITRAQVADLCKLKENQASKLLLRMRARKLIRINGNPPKGAYYTKI